MTRLDRLLLRIPRLRDLVLHRERFREHAERLQRQLDENLAREEALRRALDDAEREAGARERAIIRESAAAPQSVTDRMRADWDARARAEGTYFIATAREEWTDERFFASGEDTVRRFILNDLANICGGMDPKQMRVAEIGCGAGRVTKALACVFGEVHAVDVSPEMIRLAREKLAGMSNVHFYANSGADLRVLPELPFHFVFSFIVFQHIPDKAVVESYIREAQRILVPDGLFKFQVEGGDISNRDTADTWHGVSFSEQEMRDIAARCGFELRHTDGAGTQYFWLWMFKK
jgi:SAM-dependent methyltransferase